MATSCFILGDFGLVAVSTFVYVSTTKHMETNSYALFNFVDELARQSIGTLRGCSLDLRFANDDRLLTEWRLA